MAKDCLLTAYVASVDNDNLPVYRQLVIDVEIDSTLGVNYLQSAFQTPLSGVTVSSEIPMYSDSSLQTQISSPFTLTPNTSHTIYFPKQKGKVYVNNKYGMRKLLLAAGMSIKAEDIPYINYETDLNFQLENWRITAISGDVGKIDIPDGFIHLQGGSLIPIKDTESMASLKKFTLDSDRQLTMNNSIITGDIGVVKDVAGAIGHLVRIEESTDRDLNRITLNVEDIKDLTALTYINLMHHSVTGNLATGLGNKVNLNTINVGGHTAAEDLKNLFDALHTNGKVSGTIQVWAGSNKTLNGGEWTNGSTVTFSAGGWSVS